MLDLVRDNRFELIAFLTGASVLALEITGARLIAPAFGMSTYVWTAMIGVILGALSLGYWLGGKTADKDDPEKGIFYLLSGASILVVGISFVHEAFVDYIAEQNLDLRLSAILVALMLFSVPSLLIGMVTPHLAKIRITSLKTSGASVGKLEAAGAIGSIAGTFITGYILLGFVGSRDTILIIAILLQLTTFIINHKTRVVERLALIGGTTWLLFASSTSAMVLADIDSTYARYQVRQFPNQGSVVNGLFMDSYSIQSAYDINDPTRPVLLYTEKILELTENLQREPSNILVIGGGTYTLPSLLKMQYPEAQVTIVEIDPALTELAEDYFGYEPGSATVVHEDARTYINRSDETFDLIIVDAYSSITPPFHLVTVEAIEAMRDLLTDDGTLMANIAAFVDSELLGSLQKTYGVVFNWSETYRATFRYSEDAKQSYILAASSENHFASQNTDLVQEADGLILTDDFSPVERLSY